AEEVDAALLKAAEAYHAHITEYTVAPQINVKEGLPYHEWFIEFEKMPDNMEAFAKMINNHLRQKNIYYEDLITGNILQPLIIRPLQQNAFQQYMKSQGKLGGQNKVPRLSNDRKLADELEKWRI